MAKDRVTKPRADYTKLTKYFEQGKETLQLTREQLTKTTGGYISDNPSYLKKKNAPLARVANENGYIIEKVEKIVVYFKKKK